jgi:predicted DNA-binding ArsR family transcriptional regulator
MDTNTNYYLLLIDIISSTQLANEEFNNKMNVLTNYLKDTNKRFKSDLVLPISISYGDEIAGLFNKPKNIYNVVVEIRQIFFPLTSIRFVVVRGLIAKNSSDIRQIGGMIFKTANQTIDILKKNNHFCSWKLENLLTNKTLESLCEISNVLLREMSEYQRNVFELFRQGHSQIEIAFTLNKHPQAIWTAIQRSKAVYVVDAEHTINLILENTTQN